MRTLIFIFSFSVTAFVLQSFRIYFKAPSNLSAFAFQPYHSAQKSQDVCCINCKHLPFLHLHLKGAHSFAYLIWLSVPNEFRLFCCLSSSFVISTLVACCLHSLQSPFKLLQVSAIKVQFFIISQHIDLYCQRGNTSLFQFTIYFHQTAMANFRLATKLWTLLF